MNASVPEVEIAELALVFIPVLAVIALLWRWSLNWREAAYGALRMLVQLLLVGYVLTFIFAADHAAIVGGVLAVMLLASSWIALRPLPQRSARAWWSALLSIGLCGGAVLALVLVGVIQPDPWYGPRYVIPLAGMIFANAMNSVSLAAERFQFERTRGTSQVEARNLAYRACLIPMINTFFAVGLVSLPGMMTGQILSGVSPLIAVRYQIMVMCMLLGSSGLAAALFLHRSVKEARGKTT